MTIQEGMTQGSGRGAEYAYRIAAAAVALFLLLTWFTA
jgi:hypothetical protein